MIPGASWWAPGAPGPTPSPPKPSQSLAPTGCTPSASAVSASPQPSATTRVGSASTVTPPKAVLTVVGKVPAAAPLLAPLPAEVESEPQPARTSATVRSAAPQRARRDDIGAPSGRSGEAHLTTRLEPAREPVRPAVAGRWPAGRR